MPRNLIIVAAILVGAGILGWLFYLSTRPLPGQNIAYNCDNTMDFSKLTDVNSADRCRIHVQGQEVKYSTNPPVFGPHDPVWVQPGVYGDAKDDRNLVHSLEHGYIIMSYRCDIDTAEATASASESSLSGNLDTQSDCDTRKNELAKIYEDKGKKKLVVVPRPELDSNFALTAWSYLDKFDDFDSKRIENFINAHRDNGPEKTME